MVRLSRCCTPVPGDEIMGFVTRGRGVSVHRTDCANAAGLVDHAERLIEVEWDHDQPATFVVSVEVEALDRSRLLRDVAQVLVRVPREHPVVHVADVERPGREVPVRLRARRPEPPRLDPLGGQARRLRVRRLPGAPRPRPRRRLTGVPEPSGGREQGHRYHAPVVEPSPLSPDDKAKFRAPTGTHDVLPPESARWAALVADVRRARAERFGFGLVLTPIFEHLEVFQRVGESTDVVRKEMYDFDDKGGRRIALRPEGTAPVVRAFVQHHPPVPWKVWYVAPHFRYERPQKGRYRQHWQVGAEVLGVDDPDVDVEVIALAHGFYRGARPRRDVTLLLNSMGDEHEPSRVRRRCCASTCSTTARALGDDFRERVEANPLRVLDSKRDDWQDVIERAPQITEHLSDESRDALRAVQRGLDALGIAYELDPRLVRGFDYYTSTTFEFQSEALDAAQNAIGGGGRYDELAEEMGGQPTPGIGFGIGIERVLHRLRRRGRRARRRAARPTCSWSTALGRPADVEVAIARRRAPRGRRARRAHLRRPVGEGAEEGGRPVGRRLRRDARQATEAERGAVAVKDLRSRASRSRCPRELPSPVGSEERRESEDTER